MTIREVTSSKSPLFSKLVRKERRPAVVIFYSHTCRHCLAYAPAVEQVAAKYPLLLVLRVDVNATKTLARRFCVKKIPATLFFKTGMLQGIVYGEQTPESLETQLQNFSLVPPSPDKGQ